MKPAPATWRWALACCGVLCPGLAGAATLRAGRDASTIRATLEAAAPGDVVLVPEGTWREALVLDKAVTLRGGGDGAVIDGGGRGTVIRIRAPGARVEGLHVQGSGDDLRGPDSCIYLTPGATGAVVRGCRLRRCAFGIWVHETRRAQLLGNRIVGAETGHRSNRGNGIQLFDATGLLVRENVITGGRDGIYVSATEDSLIEGNHMSRTRYGVHYMFSYRNTMRGNVARHNDSGFALMESHHLVVVDNVAADNDEHGILFRDTEYSRIEGNKVIHNGEGLFFFSSTENRIVGNRIIRNTVGAKIWAGSLRNVVSGNVFAGNRRQLFYVGTKDLVWDRKAGGNLWADYLGWDQDGDGIGDRPYRVDSFTTALVHRFPSAALLLRSPALELLGHLERRMPVLRVPTVVDRRPLVRVSRVAAEPVARGAARPAARGAAKPAARGAP